MMPLAGKAMIGMNRKNVFSFLVGAALSFLAAIAMIFWPQLRKSPPTKALPTKRAESIPPCLLRATHGMCSFLAAKRKNQTSVDKTYVQCTADPIGVFRKATPANGIEPSGRGVYHDAFRSRVKRMRENGSAIKVFLGEGGRGRDTKYPDWLSTDRDQMDAFKVTHWASLSQASGGITALFAEHVLEHFTPTQVSFLASMSFLVLKPGGRIRVAVPDGYNPDPKYIHYVRVGGTTGSLGANHQVIWTVETLPKLFSAVGFDIVVHEYWDLNGVFHRNEDESVEEIKIWGWVERSSREMQRMHAQGKLKKYGQNGNWTSLYFDAIKPESCHQRAYIE